MSFYGSHAEAKSIIASIELSNTHGSHETSPILRGVDNAPIRGKHDASKPAGEVQMVGRLRAGIKTPKTRTDKLTRKLAAT